MIALSQRKPFSAGFFAEWDSSASCSPKGIIQRAVHVPRSSKVFESALDSTFEATLPACSRSVGLASRPRQHLFGNANRVCERFLFDAIPSYRGSFPKSLWRNVSQQLVLQTFYLVIFLLI